MFWLKMLWGVLTGNLSGIVTTITNYFGKLSDNETARLQTAIGADKEVAVAQIQTAANLYHDRVDLLKGFWITQVLIALILLPPIIHSGAIYLDSTFCNDKLHQCTAVGYWLGMPWRVPEAPAPYDAREWSLIASVLGIQSATTVGAGFVKMLLRK